MVFRTLIVLALLLLGCSEANAQACAPGVTCWSTAARPTGPGTGQTGWNTTFKAQEWFNGTSWQSAPVLMAVNYGVRADGSTSDDTAMAAALTACTSGATLILPQGTIVMGTTSSTIGSNCRLQGGGQGNTIIQRKSTNTSTVLFTITGHNIVVENMTFDCNRGASSTAANCMQWTTGFYDVHLRNMRVTGAKTVSTLGVGIEIQATGADAANTTRSSMENVSSDNNDANGVELRGDNGFDVIAGYYCSNGGGGFGLDNGNPVSPTVLNVVFNGGKYCNNGTAGVGSTSFLFPVGEFVTINGVEAYGNGTYGIVADGRHMAVTGNNVHDNGIGSITYGGILANCDQCIISDNLVFHNDYFGIDAGACSTCLVTNNYIDKSGNPTQTGGNAVWLGSATDTIVSNNRIHLDISTTAAQGISSNKYEPGMPTLGSGIIVKNNQIIMTTASQWGMLFSADAEGSIYENEVILPAATPSAAVQAYGLNANHVTSNNNKIVDPSGTAYVAITSGTTTVINDGGTDFNVSGTAAISTLNTTNLNSNKNKVIGALITNHGSGVTVPASVVVTFGSCPGSTPTGTVNAANNYGVAAWAGQVFSINMTSGGANCNPASPPSCTISGGGATGATCQSIVMVSNMAQRVVNLWLSGGATIVSGGNIVLNNGQTSIGGTNAMVSLVGDDAGSWHATGSDGSGGAASIWTTATRPGSPTSGQTGYNSTLKTMEWWDGTNWQQTQPPAIFWVDAFGAAGDGTTDDTTAFANALTACTNAGGGMVQISAKQYFINSSITVPANCQLLGNTQGGATKPSTSFSGIRYLILLNSATVGTSGNGKTGNGATINTSGSSTNRGTRIAGISMMPATMNRAPANVRDYVDIMKAMATNGTAITNSGADSYIEKIAMWGFNKCVDSSNTGRLTVDGLLGDCINGVLLDGSHDTSWISNTQIAFYESGGVSNTAAYSVTAAANNGSGLYRLTYSGTPTLVTGDIVGVGASNISSINNRWTVTAIDATHVDLQGSVFGGPVTTATTTYGRKVISVTSAANISYGQAVSGTGVQATTTVEAVWPAKNLVWLSLPASATGTGVSLTFAEPALSGGTTQIILSPLIRPGGKAFSCTNSEGTHYVSDAAEGPDVGFYFGTLCGWAECTSCAVDQNGLFSGMGSAGPYGFSDPLNIGVWFDSTSYASSYSGYLDSQGRAVINTSSGAGGHGNRVINTNLGVMGGPNSTVLEYSGAGNFLVEGNRAAGGSFLFVADSAGLLTLGDNDMTFTVWPYAQSYAALNKVVGGGTTFPASAPETVYPKTQQIIGSFIINGDMNIDQPHEGATFATCVGNSIVRLIDRWKCYNFNSGPTTAGTWQRITTGLTTYPYALQLTVSGTAVALAAGNQIHIDTGLEGGQFQLLGWGTNFGTPAVLDFCAKSSVTGTYGGWLRNTGGTFYYQFQYVISAANTWTCFSQNIPAPLGSGGFASPPINGSYYVYVGFDLGTGSTSNNATLGWTVPTSGTRVHLTGSVNLTNTANAVMAWTGVHLRAGTLQFAPYQQREFGDELNLVSRFYQKSFPPGIIPVQNGGLAGATCTTSQTATATSGRPNVYIRLNPAFQGAPAITTYNPAVADANWRDVTTTAASVPVSVDPSTAKSATGFQITSGATTSVLANDNICIHWSADTVGNEN